MKSETLEIELEFMGNYKEPNLQLTVSMEELVQNEAIEYTMVFDSTTGNWELVLKHNKNKEMIGIGEFK